MMTTRCTDGGREAIKLAAIESTLRVCITLETLCTSTLQIFPDPSSTFLSLHVWRPHL
jgi:hypothetical protein